MTDLEIRARGLDALARAAVQDGLGTVLQDLRSLAQTVREYRNMGRGGNVTLAQLEQRVLDAIGALDRFTGEI